jgi:hypothetical protein
MLHPTHATLTIQSKIKAHRSALRVKRTQITKSENNAR